MADNLTQSEMSMLVAVIDGTALEQLQQIRDDVNNADDQLIDINLNISKLPNGPDKTNKQNIAAKARAANLAARQSLNQAVDNYNSIVGIVRTFSEGEVAMPFAGLGNLGMEPVTLALVVAGAAIGIAILLDKVAVLISAAQGHSIETKGYLEQLADVAQQGSGLLITVAVILGIGVAGYFGYRWYESRSKGAKA